MKNILFILAILFSINSFSQGNVTGNRVQANTNLLPPIDTFAAPYRVGEIRTKVSGGDTLFFQCISLSAPRKWAYVKMTIVPLSIQKVGDSTIFWINGTRFATKDSIGGTLPTIPSGYAYISTGSGTVDSSIALYVDRALKRIAIGHNTPLDALDLVGSAQYIRVGFDGSNYMRMGYAGANRIMAFGGQFIISHSGTNMLGLGTGGVGFVGATTTTTGWVNFPASTTTKAAIFLTDGVDPSSPANGQLWRKGDSIYYRNTSNTINITSGDSKTGVYAANGDGILTTFTVTHGFSATPTNVQVTPAGVDSAIPLFVSNITATTFDVTFTTPPIVGTNNVTFYWLAK